MLPSAADLRSIPQDLLERFVELHLNPSSLAVLTRALSLGVFDTLAERGPTDAATLCAAWEGEATAVSVEMTLTLLRGHGLLDQDGPRYALSEMSRLFLTQRAPARMVGLGQRHAVYLSGVGAFSDALLHMRRADRRMWASRSSQEEKARYFTARQAFNERSRLYFWESAALLFRAHLDRDFRRHQVVCDVASGPAAFAALVKKAHPHLRVLAAEVNFKDPEYREGTLKHLSIEGLEVELLPVDVLHEPLPAGVDLITLNRLYSGVPREGGSEWAARLFEALTPGGELAAVDFFTTGDPRHDRAVSNLYSLWMGWNQHELTVRPPTDPDDDRHSWGWSPPWSCEELAEVLTSVGFVDVRSRSVVPPFALVEAKKP